MRASALVRPLFFSRARARGTVQERGLVLAAGDAGKTARQYRQFCPRAREEHQPPRPLRKPVYLETQTSKKRKVLARAREFVFRALLFHIARLPGQIGHSGEEFREIKYARAELRVV